MTSRQQQSALLLYKFFAIFSLLFQVFYPLTLAVVPAYASSVATQSAELESSQDYEKSAEMVIPEEQAPYDQELEGDEATDEEEHEDPLDEQVLPDQSSDELVHSETLANEKVDEGKITEEAASSEKTENYDESLYVDQVNLNETYIFTDSLVQQVQLTFTKIDGIRGDLHIHEIELSDEQMSNLGAVTSVAYDITSSMPNGSFAYDLSVLLPEVEESNLEIVYAASADKLNEVEEIENENVVGKAVQVKGLDHFTVFMVVQSTETSTSLATPSTNQNNKEKGWAHVVQLEQYLGSTELMFVSNRNFASCFEYRTDGDENQKIGENNFNNEITDGLYPYFCVNNNSRKEIIHASEFVEVRMVFGAEKDERFDWTRFDVIPHPDPLGQHQLNISGTLYRDHKMNDCFNMSTCNNRGENLGEGWTVNLYEETHEGWSLIQTRPTDTAGIFRFSTLKEAGTYHVCPVVNPGWTQQVQTWSGSGYLVNTANNSGASGEGPLCSTVNYDDTGDKSNKSNHGMVDTRKPVTTILGPEDGGYYNGGTINIQIKSTDSESGIAKVVANLYKKNGDTSSLISSCVNQKVNPSQSEYYFECTLNVDGLDDGGYFIKTNANDKGGNVSNTPTWHFTVDKTAPSTPVWQGLYKGHGALGDLISCGTEENPALVNTTKISYEWLSNSDDTVSYWFGTKFNQFHENFAHPTNLKKANMTPGNNPYWYTVIAVDQAGNTSQPSEKCWVVLDQEAPGIPNIEFPAEDQYFNSQPILNDWTDVADETGISFYRVEYQYDDGHTFSNAPFRTATNSQRNHTPSNSEQGGVKFRVQAVDKAGNEGGWSEWRHYFYDLTAPKVNLNSPSDSEILRGSIDIVGTVLDEHLSHYWLNISGNGFSDGPGTVHSEELSTPTTLFTWDTTQVQDGQYTIKLEARDKAGNKDDGSVHWVVVTVDNTAPTSFIIPPEGAVVEDDTIIINNWDGSIAGTATDDTSGVAKVWLSIANQEGEYWDGDSWEIGTEESIRFEANGTDSWTYQLPIAPEVGTYIIKSHAEDLVGNLEQTATLIIIYEKTIPTVSLTLSPAETDGKRGWYITKPTLTLTAADENGIDRIEYQWNSSEGEWHLYEGPLTPPSQGSNQFYYRAIDKAGNGQDEIGTKTVLFDSEAPGEPESMTIHRDGNQAEIVWDEAADNVGIYRYEIIWEHEETGERYSERVDDDVRSIFIEDLADGQWSVKVRAEDRAGWTTSVSKNLTIGAGQVSGVSTLVEALSEGIGGPISFLTGEVLGAETTDSANDAVVNESISQAEGIEGQVAGAQTECSVTMQYLPLIMLAALLVVLVILELFVQASPLAKTIAALLSAGAAMLAMWLVGESNCYAPNSITATISNWFWLASLVTGLGVRVLGTLLIEDK